MTPQNEKEVIVVDVKMRFWSMVAFMVKWVFASIPALVILAFMWAVALGLFQKVFGGHGWWQGRFH